MRTRTSDLTPLQTWLQTTHASWRSLLSKSDKVQYFIHFVHLYVASVFLLKKNPSVALQVVGVCMSVG